jgi:apolipoprotein D and lipocalin family protein
MVGTTVIATNQQTGIAMNKIGIVLFSLCLASCAEIPETINPVTDFDVNKYTGKWYEIARLDHRFERGLEKVTATYSINEDGTVKVENRGFSTKNKEWEDAVGKARFAGDKNIGHLEVSFFGPFYGSYVIFDLDKENYQYSFVTGSENSLWFLSRTPEVSEQLKERFLGIVQQAGYDTEGLIFVNQQ